MRQTVASIRGKWMGKVTGFVIGSIRWGLTPTDASNFFAPTDASKNSNRKSILSFLIKFSSLVSSDPKPHVYCRQGRSHRAQMTTAADQYCYLLNGWGWLATQAGYAGLAVFIDESEYYSLLTQRNKERADNFFKALIYTALGARGRISESDLQHQHRAHSFRLTERSHLLLLFAVTPSANTFDYRRWLGEEQVLALSKYLPPADLDELMARLYTLHHQAYARTDGEQFSEVAQGLLECLDSNLINLRQVIRLAVEILDLCYAHKDYTTTQAAAELRNALLS